MPPRNKTRKRGSTESDKSKDGDQFLEPTDLRSPSEVVKMRKKSGLNTAAATGTITTNDSPPKDSAKEKDTKTTNRKKSQQTKTNRRSQENNTEKKRDGSKKNKNEGEQKKTKALKDRKKSLKKGAHPDVIDANSVLFPCGICTKEVCDTDDAILCEAGCEFWYHRMCTGMTDIAYQLLTNEENVEWVCDKCIATKSVELVKMRSIIDSV